MSIRPIACGSAAIAAIMLFASAVPAQQASRGTEVSAAGITLHAVDVELPASDRMFPGGTTADAINANCLACHSAGMVLAQPPLGKAAWQAEVEKMRHTFHAPVAAEDVPAIVAYLVSIKGAKE